MFQWLIAKWNTFRNCLRRSQEFQTLRATAELQCTRNRILQDVLVMVSEKADSDRSSMAALLGAIVLQQNHCLEIPVDLVRACTDLELDIQFDKTAQLFRVNILVAEEKTNAEKE